MSRPDTITLQRSPGIDPTTGAPIYPTQPGRYICYPDAHTPIPLILGWHPEVGQDDWRHGAVKVKIVEWYGPLPPAPTPRKGKRA